jgi:predicted enzyme related to lactoylglutathione lyase
MPRVNYFAIPADVPDRAISFYREVFGWRFDVGWEYDTPQGKETYWHVITGDGGSPGINGGLTRRESPGQPISVGIEVPAVDACTALVEKCPETSETDNVFGFRNKSGPSRSCARVPRSSRGAPGYRLRLASEYPSCSLPYAGRRHW